MNTSTSSAGRRLPYYGAMLVAAGLLGCVPRFALIEPASTPTETGFLYQVLLNILLIILGGGTLCFAQRQPATDTYQRITYGSFLVLAVLNVGPALAAGRTNVIEFLRPVGSILIVVGAAGLWGTALARRENPSDTRTKSLSVTYATVAFAGFAASTVPEMLSMTMLLGSPGGLTRSPYLAGGLLLMPSRLCLFCAAVQPFRHLPDERAIRKSASFSHIVLTVWVILSVLGLVSTLLIYLPRRGSSASFTMSSSAIVWRIFAYYTLLATAVAGVLLSRQNPPGGYKSTPGINSSGGAEA